LHPEVSEQISIDQQLAHRIRNGENAAFAELYALYKHGVYLYCTRFLGNSPAAEDIFQDVFMNCFEHIRRNEGITNLRGYLLSSAHNRCLNELRQRKFPMDISDCEEDVSVQPDDFDGPQQVHQLLQCVPAENREALVLKEYEGFSYDEIAEMTGVPLSTVRKRIFRARQKLRRLLEKNDNIL
jgi:RNA polymerase sigma-70 factor (ECF subfamily)